MKDVITRTNRFYIEMSRKVLSEKEYDVLQKLLIEKLRFRKWPPFMGSRVKEFAKFTKEHIKK